MNQNQIKIANILRNISRYTFLILGSALLVFSLLSGAERYGGGLNGLIQNSPNAIPWVILLLFVYVAWKWELIGGIILTLLGLGMIYFFNFSGPNFYIVTFILTILITLLGSLFLISWYLRREKINPDN